MPLSLRESPERLPGGLFNARPKEYGDKLAAVLNRKHLFSPLSFTIMSDVFKANKMRADDLSTKAKKVSKGKTMSNAGIDPEWMTVFRRVAERTDCDRRYGLIRYPEEAGPAVGAFVCGFFDHREWPPRKDLKKHASMRAVAEYEAKYINAAGYWSAFHEACIDLRQQALDESRDENASKFDVWGLIAVRYTLRILGLRAEFYRLAADDPTYAKMVLPALEPRGDVAAADDLDGLLGELVI